MLQIQPFLEFLKNGEPADVQALVNQVGKESKSTTFTKDTLTSGVQVLSNPSAMAAPVWQLVSSELGSIPLRVVTLQYENQPKC